MFSFLIVFKIFNFSKFLDTPTSTFYVDLNLKPIIKISKDFGLFKT